MPEPLAYLNGQFLPQTQLHLSYADAGFVFGATVTDLCRTFRHRLFRLAEHLARFRSSCRYAHIPQPVPDEALSRAAEQLVTHNAALSSPQQDLALVLFATPGLLGHYAGLQGGPGDAAPTLAMHTFPLPFSRYARLFRDGAHLVIPTIRHVPADCIDPRIKQRSRLHWWLAEREAHASDPAAIALLLDGNGHITETAGANFLLVRGGTVLSPPRSSVLGGISLQTTEELCGDLNIPFREQPLSVDDCHTADEALLTSTPYGIAGVSRIIGVPLRWPGSVLRRLLNAWNRRAGLDIRGQILAGR